MKSLLILLLPLAFTCNIYSQSNQLLIGVTGFTSTEMDVSPQVRFRHYLNSGSHRFGLGLNYSQNHFMDVADEYTPEVALLYSFSYNLSGSSIYTAIGPSLLYRFNANPKSKISRGFLGSQLAVGYNFTDFLIELNYLLVPSEIESDGFFSGRSTLGFGLGYQF